MAKKDLKEWQELRMKLLENYFFYRNACEIDTVAVWPKNMGEYTGVTEHTAEYWLKGIYIPSKRHIVKIRAYCKRLKPLTTLSEGSKEYIKELLKSAEETIKSLKQID